MIHTHAQCGLQIQNIIHKLMHFASEKNTVCFTQSTKNNSTSTEHESCAWIGMHLRTDRNAFAHGSARRRISAKSHVTNKCPVIHTTQQQVALLSQFKAARTIFFLPKIFICNTFSLRACRFLTNGQWLWLQILTQKGTLVLLFSTHGVFNSLQCNPFTGDPTAAHRDAMSIHPIG